MTPIEEKIVSALTSQVPELVIFTFLAITFLRSIRDRDALYADLMNRMISAMDVLDKRMTEHGIETTMAINEMRREVDRNQKTAAKQRRRKTD